jgi:hypothetical protein
MMNIKILLMGLITTTAHLHLQSPLLMLISSPTYYYYCHYLNRNSSVRDCAAKQSVLGILHSVQTGYGAQMVPGVLSHCSVIKKNTIDKGIKITDYKN